MDGHLGKVSGSKDSMYASCTANKCFEAANHVISQIRLLMLPDVVG